MSLLQTTKAATKTTIPFDGNPLRNPFAKALMSEVPSDMYTPRNVWTMGANGTIAFQPWLWRFCSACALNRLVEYYNHVNVGDGFRGYKRRERERKGTM